MECKIMENSMTPKSMIFFVCTESHCFQISIAALTVHSISIPPFDFLVLSHTPSNANAPFPSPRGHRVGGWNLSPPPASA